MLDLLTTREAAAELRVHPVTMARWRALGIGPNAIPVQGRWMYERATIEEYLSRMKNAGKRHAESGKKVAEQRARDALGTALRTIRHSAKLSQRELAEKAGVPAWRVCGFENGLIPSPRENEVLAVVRAAGAGDQEDEVMALWLARLPKVEVSI